MPRESQNVLGAWGIIAELREQSGARRHEAWGRDQAGAFAALKASELQISVKSRDRVANTLPPVGKERIALLAVQSGGVGMSAFASEADQI